MWSFNVAGLESKSQSTLNTKPGNDNVVVEPFSGASLKDNKKRLEEMVALWVQLDKAEENYDKPFGLVMAANGDLREFFRTKILSSSGYILLDGDKCIGMAFTRKSEYENSYHISVVVIDNSYRGKGYGKKLLSYIIEKHKGQKALLRVSMNNPAGLALYKSLGFVPMTQVMIRK